MDTTDGRLTRWLLCSICFTAFAFSSVLTNAAPADGLVFWNPADKGPSILLSNGNMDIAITDPYVLSGVRGNRPINPGEGLYYVELRNLTPAENFVSFGIATSDVPLESIGAANGAAKVSLDNVPAIGMIVDYRGEYPVAHFFTDFGAGIEHVDTLYLHDYSGPVYPFLATVVNEANANGQARHRLNYGTVEPFIFDLNAAINLLYFDGTQELEYGWPIDNAKPNVTIAGANTVTVAGGSLSFSAFANDAESGNITSSVNWFLDDLPAGSGGSLVVSPPAGSHVVRAEVLDGAGQRAFDSVRAEVLTNEGLDSDYDGIPYYVEIENGTNPGARDTDFDGLSDSEESTHSTDPLSSDTDGDGITDGYEVEHGLNPLADDAGADLDADTFNNLDEFFAGRSASNANDFPGHGTVLLNAADAHTNIQLQPDALSFSVTPASGLGAVRSDISIAQGSGWHYYEGRRLTDVGNFGFGVATATALLTAPAGSDTQSVGVSADGNITYNGAVIMTLAAAQYITEYGIAVDYSAANPDVYIVARPAGGDYEVSPPISMTGIVAPLHIFAYGESQSGVVQQSINAGQNKRDLPFAYSARYLLYRAGHTDAEFMREGWGPEYVYQPLSSVPLENDVRFVREKMTSPLATISRDGTELGWIGQDDRRLAVRANQSMVGEFRYWEAELKVSGPVDTASGYGLLNPFGRIDPYCCGGTELTTAPPSLIVNSTDNVWRNLVWQESLAAVNKTFGFAVDYLGSRPTVYVIHNGSVVHTALLDDFITPIVPLLYGGQVGVGPVPVAGANFGQKPFSNDARQALIDAGVNVSQFVPGWGIYEQPKHLADGPLTEPVISWTGASAGLTGQPVNITAIATDAEDGDLTAQILWNNDQTAALGTGGTYDFTPPTTGIYRVTARVTDSSGLEYVGTVELPVTDTDTTSPVISVPPPLVVNLPAGSSLPAGNAQIAAFLAAAVASDDVDGAVGVTHDAPATFSVGVTNINFAAADAAGNIGTAISSISVIDTGAPALTVPANATIGLTSGTTLPATDPAVVAFLASATASDDVDGSLTVANDAPGSFPLGVTTVNFTATDAAGNAANASATLTVNDAGEPNITVPADIALDLAAGNSIPASDPAIAAFLSGATAADDVDGTLAVTHDAPASFAVGATTVTFSATDAAGNTGTATATVTVSDTGAPNVTAPADIALNLAAGATIPATDAAIAAFLSGASAIDDVDGTLGVTHDAPANFPVGVTTVTFSATDAAGNTNAASATVTITDTGAPDVTAPAAIAVSLASGSSLPASDTAIVNFLAAATASDDVDGALSVTHDAPAAFPIGITTVTFSATDVAGNTTDATSTVTINDTGLPVVAAPADIAIDLPVGASVPLSDAAIAAFIAAATASDDVDGALTVSHDAPANFAVGVTTVTFSATDAAGNIGTAAATVTVNDTGAPNVSAPASIVVAASSGNSLPAADPTIAAFLAAATAADDVDGSTVVTHDAPASFAIGATAVTFTSADAAGNIGTASATVTVNDTGAPTVTAPADLALDLATGNSIAVTDAAIAAFLSTASAADDVDGSVAVTHDAPASFPIGPTLVTFTATDSAGNIGTASATVTISDTGAPAVTAPADIAVGAATGNSLPASNAAIAAFLSGASASDDVDGNVAVTHDAPASFSVGATVVTFSATDAAGNSATATATVTVNDTGAPTVTAPADLPLSLASGNSIPASDPAIAAFLSGASANDDVDGSVTVTHDAPASFAPGATLVTFSATDLAGNIGTATATVSISDTGAPVLSIPANLTVNLPAGANVPVTDPAIAAFLSAATATDDVEGIRPVTNNAPPVFLPGATTVVTFTSADTAGNTASANSNVTVVDTGAPTLSLPDDLIVGLASGTQTPVSNPAIAAFLAAATASDDVDGSLTVSHNAPATFPVATTTVVSFSAVDTAGNATSATRSITVNDTGAPSLTVPTDIIIEAETGATVPASHPAIAAFLALATATDDVDPSPVVTNDAPGIFPIGLTTVTFTATDSAGNTANSVSHVVVSDTGDPTVIAPADLAINLSAGNSVAATDPAIAAFLALANAIDVVDGTIPVTNDAPASFPMGTTVVTFSATDSAGNTGSATAAVTVSDAGAPLVTSPADITVGIATGTAAPATHPAIAAFLAGAAAIDDVDGPLGVANDAPASFPIGITTVTFSAIDAAGNSANATAIVTVTDSGLPVVTAPADLALSLTLGSSLSATDPAIAGFLAAASATDEVDGTVAVTHDAPADFPVGITTVTFSATDSAGNTAAASATVSITDGGAPTVAAPADMVINLSTGSTVSVGDAAIAAFLNSATAVDSVDGTVAVTHDAPTTFAIGVTTVTFSATDSVGNTSTASATVTVVDTGAPFITPPAGITINVVDGSDIPASDPAIAAFLSAVSASDDVDGAVAVTDDAPAAFAPGVTTVTFTATDAAGNIGTGTSSVAVSVTNVAPIASIEIQQGGVSVTTVTRDGGLVTLVASVIDANVIDSHTYDWNGTDSTLVPQGDSTSQTFVFDPAALGQGVYSLSLSVTDDGNAPMTGSASNLVRVIDTAPALSSTEDSDADGTSDADEGAGDSDGDRIPDYLDPAGNTAAQLPAGDNGALIETSAGLVLRLGGTAFTVDAADSVLTIDEIEAWATAVAGGVASGMDDDYLYSGGIFDIEVTNAPVGGTAQISIALADALPANATMRDFVMANGWSRFLTDTDNLVQSAPGSLGSCPMPGSTEYTDGLTQGHFCIQLSITDGGANDADGIADGTIRLLGGPAQYIGPTPAIQVQAVGMSAPVFHANDGERVVLDLIVSSDSDDAEIHELTIGASGELNESSSVSSVALYLDANNDGVADASERLATGSYTSDDGQVTFTLSTPQGLSSGDNRFLVTYNF